MILVAGYCRVSTDREDQANSFAVQQRFFREYIEGHSDWELAQIYADEGITGTSTKKRVQFNQMIRDAYDGRFQLILTKEVSRFSRNLLDTISYTRELKAIGVSVWFLTDGIHTKDPDAELRLSIMASLAQEESRRTSGRVTWGQTRQMERGVVFGTSLLGYDVKNGRLTINASGAELVRLIFRKYAVEGQSMGAIAHFLQEGGYPSVRGGKWSPGTVSKILHNEKYVGDLVQKKSYTPDYLTHEKKSNCGEVEKIVLLQHHDPIIDRDLWEQTQERLRRNRKLGNAGHCSVQYLFSGKIRCGQCGGSFVRRQKTGRDGRTFYRWGCRRAMVEGGTVHMDACGRQFGCDVGHLLREDTAQTLVQTALRALSLEQTGVIETLTAQILQAMQANDSAASQTLTRLQGDYRRLCKKQETMLDSFCAGEMTREELHRMNTRYRMDAERLQEKLRAAELEVQQIPDWNERTKRIPRMLTAFLSGEQISEHFLQTLLDHITVYQDHRLELQFQHLPQRFIFAKGQLSQKPEDLRQEKP